MKKYLIKLIVMAVFIAYMPTGGIVSAQEETSSVIEPITITSENSEELVDMEEVESYVEETVMSEEQVETTFSTEGEVNEVESNLDTGDVLITSELAYNEDTGEMTVDATLKDNYGNDIHKTFSILLLSGANDEEIDAIFTDEETGEQYEVNTAEVTASVWPVVGVLVAFIAKQGLKAAIKKWGPKIVAGMIRTSETVAKEAAKNLGYSATNYTSHGAKVYKLSKGKGPKYITRDKDGHNGGSWKGADSVEKLGSKKTRSGTYDAELNRIGD